jgi:hypothetical protein
MNEVIENLNLKPNFFKDLNKKKGSKKKYAITDILSKIFKKELIFRK